MKNAIKLFGIIVFAAVIGFSMTSCGGGLNGTYEDGRGSSFTFTGKDVAMDFGGVKFEGTFEAKEGKLTITSTDNVKLDYDYTLKNDKLTLKQKNSAITEEYTKKK